MERLKEPVPPMDNILSNLTLPPFDGALPMHAQLLSLKIANPANLLNHISHRYASTRSALPQRSCSEFLVV